MSDVQAPLSPERAEEVLAALRGPVGGYPAAAVAEAVEHLDELEPQLLALLAEYADDPVAADEQHGGMAPIFTAYLLAHGRKSSAHPTLLRILSLPGEGPYDVFGDLVTEDMPALLWQTCASDLSGVLELARDREADSYCRAACLDVLSYAWAEGAVSREGAIAVLQEVLTTAKEAPDDGVVVNQAISLLCDLHPGESLDLIREVFALGLVDPFWVAWDEVQVWAERDPEQALQELRRQRLEQLAGTPHEHLHGWAAFREDRAQQPSHRVVGQPPLRTKDQQRRERNKKKQARKARKKNRKKSRRKR